MALSTINTTNPPAIPLRNVFPSGSSSSTENSPRQSGSGSRTNRSNGASTGPQNQNASPEQNRPDSLPNAPRPPGVRQAIGQNGQSDETSDSRRSPSTAPGADSTRSGGESSSKTPGELTPAERRVVQRLKRIDQRVRAHEQAHLAAAGQYARGGINFEFQTGPDGNRYAVGGEVSLDTSKASSPEKTIQKMRQVRKAALAPADPSPQDRSVANQASQKLQEARRKQAQQEGESSPVSGAPATGESQGSSASEDTDNEFDLGPEGVEDFGRSGSTRGTDPQNSLFGDRDSQVAATRSAESGRDNRRTTAEELRDQLVTETPSSNPTISGGTLNLLA